jgi:pimeloyl-ACP methyl ester carboxylesterase
MVVLGASQLTTTVWQQPTSAQTPPGFAVKSKTSSASGYVHRTGQYDLRAKALISKPREAEPRNNRLSRTIGNSRERSHDDAANQNPQAFQRVCDPRTKPSLPSQSATILIDPEVSNGKNCSDTQFLIDKASAANGNLDTPLGCPSGSFAVPIDRYISKTPKLLIQNQLIGPTATVTIGVFRQGSQIPFTVQETLFFNDVEVPSANIDRVHPGSSGPDRIQFRVPIADVNFPAEGASPAQNIIRLQLNATIVNGQIFCPDFYVDWITINIEVARPVLLVHGIFSKPGNWAPVWTQGLEDLGIPNDTIDLRSAFLAEPMSSVPIQTIGTNAGKIRDKVGELQQRWKVDKINLIGHSKGGLDAREFAEDSESVSQLIQIGTPNSGTFAADGIIVGATVLANALSPDGAVIINDLGLEIFPGSYQLTRTYMTGYNFWHGRNKNVRYTALAGVYTRPDCILCDFFDTVLGSDDRVVAESSVHSLNYADNITFAPPSGPICPLFTQSTDLGCDAVHTYQTGSKALFEILKPKIVELEPRDGNKSKSDISLEGGQNTESSVTSASTMSKVGIIQQGQTQTQTIKVDQGSQVFFNLLYHSGNLDLALISPSGQRFDRVTVQGNPNVGVGDEAILGGRMETFRFTNLQAGIWSAEVTAPSVVEPAGKAGYALTGWMLNSPITLAGSFQSSNVSVGNPLRLLGTLRNSGAPVLNAVVTALVVLPNSSKQQVTLRDDGLSGDAPANDGIYTATFASTTLPGTYRVVFQADRGASGGLPAFSREVLSSATVSNSGSAFTGMFTSSGVDTNSNALFDKLTVQATLNITQNGNYRLVGTLADTAGNLQDAKTLITLSAGTRVVNLDFDGSRLYANRVSGPYRLASVSLLEDNSSDPILLDTRTDAHQTTAFQFGAFEHGPIALTKNRSAIGIDTNGNGLFDLLRTTLQIDVKTAGNYTCSAQLVDRNGRMLEVVKATVSFNIGTNSLNIDFDGRKIGANGVDGPYSVTGLVVQGSSASLLESNLLNSPAYKFTQFENAGPTPTPTPTPTATPSPSPTATPTPTPPSCPAKLSQSASSAIVSGNSVSCNGGAPNSFHADNSYWRAFKLTSFGVTGQYSVASVDFGVDVANAAGTGTTQPVTVRLYTNNGASFPGGTRTQIGTATVQLPDLSGTLINVALRATVPAATSELVIEVFTPSGQSTGNQFFIGSNSLAESGASYISAASCGITNPITTAAAGFPNMHVVMDINGACAANPLDAANFFVQQHYLDFLSRQPDPSGLAFWTNEITSCGSNQACIELKRINVSAAYYLSIEFQGTGYLVERIYKAAYGDASATSTFGGSHQLLVPVIRLNEFLPDTQEIGNGVIVGQTGWEQVLENNKQAFASEFVQRSRFTTAFPASMTPAAFVATLNLKADSPLSQSEFNQLVSDLSTGAKTRAQVLRAIAEHPNLINAEFNRAFVLMQFFGYLRRNPNDPQDTDYSGYDFWLTKLNQFNGNFQNAEMVKAFIVSGEYRNRFGP